MQPLLWPLLEHHHVQLQHVPHECISAECVGSACEGGFIEVLDSQGTVLASDEHFQANINNKKRFELAVALVERVREGELAASAPKAA